MGPCIQQDATLHSLYLETALHVSGGTSTHHQERIQLYLQHLGFVTPLTAVAAQHMSAKLPLADTCVAASGFCASVEKKKTRKFASPINP
jgi:hypothetical protein